MGGEFAELVEVLRDLATSLRRHPEAETFLDRHDLAARWRCSVDTVDRVLRRDSDVLRVISVGGKGGKPLVRRDDLERYEAEHAPSAYSSG